MLQKYGKFAREFFPKSYLSKKGVSELEANNILNITFVDDYLNEREIGAKAPSIYMAKYKAQNEALSTCMKSHLIADLDAFGIMTDDYQLFLQTRAERVSQELQKRIIPLEIDEKGQVSRLNALEDAEAA